MTVEQNRGEMLRRFQELIWNYKNLRSSGEGKEELYVYVCVCVCMCVCVYVCVCVHIETSHFILYREVVLFLMYSGTSLGPDILSSIERLSSFLCTVEPLNKGHIGTSHFVLYREVVLFLMYSGTSE